MLAMQQLNDEAVCLYTSIFPPYSSPIVSLNVLFYWSLFLQWLDIGSDDDNRVIFGSFWARV
jgi:hypothetical protein